MIILTVIAEEKLRILIGDNLVLRFQISDREPKGHLYSPAIFKKNDIVVETRSLKFLVDPDSKKYINIKFPKGILLYWVGGPDSHGFVIEAKSDLYESGYKPS